MFSTHLATQEEITKELTDIYNELCLEYPSYIESALNQAKVFSWPNDKWISLRQDLTDNPKMKLEEFKAKFPEILLSFLQKLNEQVYRNNPFVNLNEMQHTSDLLQRSFFNFVDERIEKHRLLVDTVFSINHKVKAFFFRNKDRLEIVLQSRQKLKTDGEKWKQQLKKLPQPSSNIPTVTTTLITNPTTENRKDAKTQRKEQQKQKANEIDFQIIDDGPSTVTITSASRKKNTLLEDNKVKDFTRCMCVTLLRAPSNPKKFIQCLECKQYFHASCLKVKDPEIPGFICPYCTIILWDPFFPVVNIICQPLFFQLSQPATSKNFQFSVQELPRMHCLQFRCLRLDDNHGLDEPTWPDYGEVLVNGTRVQEFKALAQNTSLKKRKDGVYTLKEKIYLNGQMNFVSLRELKPTPAELSQYRISQNQIYMACVVMVQILNPDRLTKAIKMSNESLITQEKCKQMIVDQQSDLTKKAEDIEVEKLKVTVTCPFTMQRIETPSRGSICTHIQCFSLENLIKLTFNAAHRKWRCPICKKKCFKILIDTYQKKILDQMKESKIQINEILFKEDGEIDETHFQNAENQKIQSSSEESDKFEQEEKKVQAFQSIVIDEDVNNLLYETVIKKKKVDKSMERSVQKQKDNEIILID